MVTFAQSPPNSHLQQTLPTSKITLRAPISPPYETPPDKSPPDDHRTTTRRSFCSHYRTNPLKADGQDPLKGVCYITLTQYDIEDVQEHCNNLFSQQEIVSLYKRFCQLDRNAKGFISADEFLSVPEFAMNPLSQLMPCSLYIMKCEKRLKRNMQEKKS
ncbi:putative EF-hand domain-containing protein [Helianthus annuus]|nr:putative EF-hand domain-containing protein [Helianthus annuus]